MTAYYTYTNRCRDAYANAHYNLSALTSMTDSDAIRFRSARILRAGSIQHGSAFYFIESLPAASCKRGYRVIIFNQSGHIIYTRARDQLRLSHARALADLIRYCAKHQLTID